MNLISSTINPAAGVRENIFNPDSAQFILLLIMTQKMLRSSGKMLFRMVFLLISIFNVSHYTTHYLRQQNKAV